MGTTCSLMSIRGGALHLSSHTTHTTWAVDSSCLVAALAHPLSTAVRGATAPHLDHPGVEHPPLLPAARGRRCNRLPRVRSWWLQLWVAWCLREWRLKSLEGWEWDNVWWGLPRAALELMQPHMVGTLVTPGGSCRVRQRRRSGSTRWN